MSLSNAVEVNSHLKEVPVYSLKGEVLKTRDLSRIFAIPYRPDVIRRAVLAALANRRQRYGTDPLAGKRTSAEDWGTGRGVARIPRVKGHGSQSSGRGAFAPNTVGGRKTHPPRAERSFTEKINKKERILAIKSAIAATANPILVEARGHLVDDVLYLPLIVEDKLEEITTTKQAKEVFESLGVLVDSEERARRRMSKYRAGKGKRRGRRYQRARSFLVVVSKKNNILKAAKNLPGVDVVDVNSLNAVDLAPGGHPGRLTVWTESAVDVIMQKYFEKEG